MVSSALFSQFSLPMATPLRGLVQVAARHRTALILASAFFVALVSLFALLSTLQPTDSSMARLTADEPTAYQPSQAVSRAITPTYLSQ